MSIVFCSFFTSVYSLELVTKTRVEWVPEAKVERAHDARTEGLQMEDSKHKNSWEELRPTGFLFFFTFIECIGVTVVDKIIQVSGAQFYN